MLDIVSIFLQQLFVVFLRRRIFLATIGSDLSGQGYQAIFDIPSYTHP